MKKLLILFLVVALSFIGYWGWQKYMDRSDRPENDGTIKIKNIPQEPSTAENDSMIIPPLDEPLPEPKPEPGGFRDVSTKDCANECQNFSVETELTYCQEVCGLKASENKEQACETLKNLERDYCFKDQAVAKKDFGLCEKIADPNIRKTCQNRVTEDILDQ